jgi:hypothetical protein
MKTILALVLSFIAATSFALDIPTSDGKFLRDCEIKSVEKDGLRVSHKDGSGFLDFDTLPIALQKQYGWTAEKSAARKAESAAELEKQRIATEAAQQDAAIKAAATKAEKAAEASKRRIEQEAERLANFEKARAEKAKEIAAAEKEKKAEETARDNAVLMNRLLIAGVLLCYFIPALIARGKSNGFAVFFVNLLSLAFYAAYQIGPVSPFFVLGAPALAIGCWLIALVMAFRSEMFGDRKQVVQIQNVYQPPASAPQQPRPVPRPVAQVQPVAVPRVVGKPLPPSVNPPPPTA